ncbi:MAG: HAD-IC family P-type ATPase, partial [Planctomycetota bacterium]
ARTALAIAHKIGIVTPQATTGQELEALSEEELLARLQADAVFARTTPEHKLRIVTTLQRDGHVVAMTGDGVNDAPALKKADIGIAMGLRGTDVAKGASDMILMDDNFSSIVGAVEEGRRQYDNIQKFVRYLLSSNIGEVIAVVCSILLRGPLILLPVQILWMNLVTDGLSAVALGVEPAEPAVMQRPPRAVHGRVIDRGGLWMILSLGSYVGLATLGLFLVYLASDDARQVAVAQTVAFTGIIVIQKLNVLNFRFLATPMRGSLFWSNPWVLLAITGSLLLQLAALHVPLLQEALHTQPLRVTDWAIILAVAAPVFLFTEGAKRLRERRASLSGPAA